MTMFQILMMWYGQMSNDCVYSLDFTTQIYDPAEFQFIKPTPKNMGNDQNSLLNITGIMWILMHMIGGVIRSMIYIEPYYDIPEDSDTPTWQVILF